ncbi:MAG: MFS transporter [Acidobacteria bacterium]|nr:MFS transporter [Acidobacteriota bacterium]
MNGQSSGVFYGWWVATTCMFTMSLTVGAFYYALPFLYPEIVKDMGFTREEAMRGFAIGFTVVALPFGIGAGTIIDRVGPKGVVRYGVLIVGGGLLLLGEVQTMFQYYAACITIVIGYVLSGPIPNQVLIARWFSKMRGRAMGFVYFGLGIGGVVTTMVMPTLIENYGWRRAAQMLGAAILLLIFPLVQFVTRSSPSEIGVGPDGGPPESATGESSSAGSSSLTQALRTRNFWLLLGGTWFTLFTIGTVIDNLVFHLNDQKFPVEKAKVVMTVILFSSLAGRLLVGYLADRISKKNIMAVCYLALALSIPLLFLAPKASAVWGFAALFGFFMGADYMLIPLLVAECFGLASLGKLLAVIIMGYSTGQFLGPQVGAALYDHFHSYDFAWIMVTAAGIMGATLIYFVSPPKKAEAGNESQQD